MKAIGFLKGFAGAVLVSTFAACTSDVAMQGAIQFSGDSMPKMEPVYKGLNGSKIKIVDGSTQEAVGVKIFYRSELTQCSSNIGSTAEQQNFCELEVLCPQQNCSLKDKLLDVTQGDKAQTFKMFMLARGKIQVQQKGDDFWPPFSTMMPLETMNWVPPQLPDESAPTVLIASKPETETTDRVAMFMFSGTDLDGNGVSNLNLNYVCRLDGVSYPCGSGKNSWFNTQGVVGLLNIGQHNFEVVAKDTQNTSVPATYQWSVTASNVSCVFAESSRLSGYRKNSAESLNFICTPLELVDPNSLQCLLNDNSVPCQLTDGAVTVAGLSDGPQTLKLGIKDKYGVAGSGATVAWTVDTLKPNITCPPTVDESNKYWWRTGTSAGAQPFGETCNEGVNCVTECRFTGASAYGNCFIPATLVDTTNGASTPDRVTVKATDLAGNFSEVICDIRVDNSPPSLPMVIAPAENGSVGGEVSIEFSAADAHSDVDYFLYKLNSEVEYSVTYNRSFKVADISRFNEGGSNTVKVKAVNKAGLTSAEATRNFIYSNSTPYCQDVKFVKSSVDRTILGDYTNLEFLTAQFKCQLKDKDVLTKCSFNGAAVSCGAPSADGVAATYFVSQTGIEGVNTFTVVPVSPVTGLEVASGKVEIKITRDRVAPNVACSNFTSPLYVGAEPISVDLTKNVTCDPAGGSPCDPNSYACSYRQGTNSTVMGPFSKTACQNISIGQPGTISFSFTGNDMAGNVGNSGNCTLEVLKKPEIQFTKPVPLDNPTAQPSGLWTDTKVWFDDSVKVTWSLDNDESNVTYTTDIFRDSCPSSQLVETVPGGNSWEHKNFNATAAYFIRVQAKNAQGQSLGSKCSPKLSYQYRSALKKLVVGSDNACMVNTHGDMTCWGACGSNKRIPDCNGTSSAPYAVNSNPKTSNIYFKDIALGSVHSCAIISDSNLNSKVYCWGDKNANFQLGVDTSVCPGTAGCGFSKDRAVALDYNIYTPIQVSVGNAHSCALVINKTTAATNVFCWGLNSSKQLGAGLSGTSYATPAATNLTNLKGAKIVQLASGTNFNCVLTEKTADAGGEVFCWGDNGQGQIGINSTQDAPVPTKPNFPNINLMGSAGNWNLQIALGPTHACAYHEQGYVFCWGNGDGALGRSSGNILTPTLATTVSPRTNIAAGPGKLLTASDKFTCVMDAIGSSLNHKVRCWGNAANGRLGWETGTGWWSSGLSIADGAANTITSYKSANCSSSGATPTNILGAVINIGRTSYSCAEVASDSLDFKSARYIAGGGVASNTGLFTCAIVASGPSLIEGATYSLYRPFCWGQATNNKLGESTKAYEFAPTAFKSSNDRDVFLTEDF